MVLANGHAGAVFASDINLGVQLALRGNGQGGPEFLAQDGSTTVLDAKVLVNDLGDTSTTGKVPESASTLSIMALSGAAMLGVMRVRQARA